MGVPPMHEPVYLDHHATTPVDPRVLEAMLPYFAPKFGNASSRSHSFGWEAEKAVDAARRRIASLAGATPREIVFTSGATESNNLALKGVVEAHRGPSHIVTMATEHRAVLDPAQHLERLGCRLTVLPPLPDGRIDLDRLRAAIGDEMQDEAVRTAALGDRLKGRIESAIEGVRVNGSMEHRLPGNLNLSFAQVDGPSLLMSLPDVALSTGSACSSATAAPSHVLKALGLTEDQAHSSLRFGLGRFTTEEEI